MITGFFFFALLSPLRLNGQISISEAPLTNPYACSPGPSAQAVRNQCAMRNPLKIRASYAVSHERVQWLFACFFEKKCISYLFVDRLTFFKKNFF
jgi:hypothetical protein